MPVDDKIILLLSGLATFFIIGSGMAIFGPALPVYERTFHITTATSGLLVSTLWVGCLIGVGAMYLTGKKMTPRVGLALLVLGSVLLALAPLWSVALAGALVFGMGYGVVAALFNPRVLVAFAGTGASKLSMLNAVFSFGAIISPFVFTLMGGDLRPMFWALAVMAALVWLMSGRITHTGLPPEGIARGFRLHLPILGFAAVAIGIEASLTGLGPTALIRAGVAEDTAANLLSLFFVAALTTRIVLIGTSHRFHDFGIFAAAMAFAAATALGAAFISPAFFFPMMGVSAGLFFQGGYVTATRKMGADPRVSPIILAVGLVGAIFSPLGYAHFMDGLGPRGFFWLVAGVAMLGTIASAASYRSMMR